jgi:signal transduction histidine kinase
MSPSQFRLLRVAGLGICFTLLLLRILLTARRGTFDHEMANAWWLLPMMSFAVALWFGTADRPLSPRTRMLLLVAQSVSVLTLGFIAEGLRAANYLGYMLLVITIQIVLILPMRVAIPWIVAQSSVLAVSYVVADHTDWITAAVSIIFKMFTYAVVIALKREADARTQFAALHAQMVATRELHAERSRNNERLRIARDLHDVLGHRLTALSLNLEIATHKPTLEAGRPEVEFAQELTRNLLCELREVVSATRSEGPMDLRAALERVVRGFSPISVHLRMPEELKNCDAPRGEVLVRCAQELITNAVKHARARQVWIDLELHGDRTLHLRSYDDGEVWSESATVGDGTGLASMRERFESFGGDIRAQRDPQQGFTVQAVLPMIPAAA